MSQPLNNGQVDVPFMPLKGADVAGRALRARDAALVGGQAGGVIAGVNRRAAGQQGACGIEFGAGKPSQ